jgi:hypothetical protein
MGSVPRLTQRAAVPRQLTVKTRAVAMQQGNNTGSVGGGVFYGVYSEATYRGPTTISRNVTLTLTT